MPAKTRRPRLAGRTHENSTLMNPFQIKQSRPWGAPTGCEGTGHARENPPPATNEATHRKSPAPRPLARRSRPWGAPTRRLSHG